MSADAFLAPKPLDFRTLSRKVLQLCGAKYCIGLEHDPTKPLRAVADLHGRIWRRVISKDELAEVEREHAVISTKLLAGRTLVRIHGDTAPGPGFEPAEPDLEDVYFSTMAGHIGRRSDRRTHQPEPAVAP